MHSTQLLGKKYHATAATLGTILQSWARLHGIRDNDHGRYFKRGRNRGEAWELTCIEKKTEKC